MKQVFPKLIPIAILVIMMGCRGKDENKNAIINEFVHLPSSGWRYDDVKKFSFSITDTAQPYDLIINLRNSKQYPYSNLWVYVKITSPTGDTQTERDEIRLADDLGNWLGKAKGRSLHELSHTCKKGFKFPYLGIYTLELQHAMRDSTLTQLTDIGILIQASK